MTERLKSFHSKETAPIYNGAVFQVGEIIESHSTQSVRWQAERQCTIPVTVGVNNETYAGKYLSISVVLPEWINNPHHERFQLLHGLAPVVDKNFELLSTSESCAELLKKVFGVNNLIQNPESASLILEKPDQLRQVLQTTESPLESRNSFELVHPTATQSIEIGEGGYLMQEKLSLLILALLIDDSESGPEQLLRFIYKEPAEESQTHKPKFWQRKEKKKKKEKPFLDKLVDLTTSQSELARKAAEEVDGSTEKFPSSEFVTKIAATMLNQERSLAMETAKNGTLPEELVESLNNQRTILNQMKYAVPKNKPELDDDPELEKDKKKNTSETDRIRKRRDITLYLSENIKIDRALHHQDNQDPKPDDHLYAFLLYQKGEYPLEKIGAFKTLVFQATKKPLHDLSHEEIAIILSMEMEITTRPINENESLILSASELEVVQTAQELHEYGLFYINAKLSDAHDSMALHMSGGELCLAHTPMQIQMMENIASQMQVATAQLQLPAANMASGLSSVSGFAEIFGGIGALGQGIPLLAQGLSFVGGAGTEQISHSKDSSPRRPNKPKAQEVIKSKPNVVFQSSPSGFGEEAKPRVPTKKKPRLKAKSVSKPKIKRIHTKVDPFNEVKKTKPTQLPKTVEKSKASSLLPTLTKTNKVPIFTAHQEKNPQRTLEQTANKKTETRILEPVSLLPQPSTEESETPLKTVTIIEKKRVPTIDSQPEIPARPTGNKKKNSSPSSGSPRKKVLTRGPADGNFRRREVPLGVATVSFSKRLEQTTQVKKQVEKQQKKQGAASRASETNLHIQQKQTEEEIVLSPTKTTDKQNTAKTKAKTTKPDTILEEEVHATAITAIKEEVPLEIAEQVTPSQTQEVVRSTDSATTDQVDATNPGTETDIALLRLKRKKNKELNPGRGGGGRGSTNTKKNNKKPTLIQKAPTPRTKNTTKTDRVSKAAQLSVPDTAFFDPMNAFAEVRTIKSWIIEAEKHQRWVQQHYSTPAQLV